MLFVFRLVNEHGTIPRAELFSILEGEHICYRLYMELSEFVILEIRKEYAELLTLRMAMLKEWGKLLAIADEYEIVGLAILNDIDEPYCVEEIETVRGFGKNYAVHIYNTLKSKRLLCYERPESTTKLKIVFIDGLALIYEVNKVRRGATFKYRAPHKRAAYLPGTMRPELARAFVNLARVSTLRHEVVLDPFCGVGGFAIEAGLMGLHLICTDIDRRMVSGSKANTHFYGITPYVDIAQVDAAMMSLRSHSVDAIATDPPYGRQSIPRGYTLQNLIEKFFYRALDVVKPGRHIVFAVPHTIEQFVDKLADEFSVEIREKHLDWVHGGLLRVIYVVRR